MNSITTLYDSLIIVKMVYSELKMDFMLKNWKTTKKNNILSGPNLPKILEENLVKQMYKSFENSPDLVFFVDVHTGKKTTGADLIRDVRAVSLNLVASLNLKADDVVVACSENRLEVVILQIACWTQGIIFSPINSLYTTAELDHILNTIKPSILFCSDKIVARCRQFRKGLKAIVTFSGLPEDFAYGELLKDPGEDVPFVWTVPVALDSVAALFCSSGTTGPPKCVELTYNNLLYMISNSVVVIPKTIYQTVNGLITSAVFLPLFHIFGNKIALDGIVQQKTSILFGRFEISLFLQSIALYKITELYVVPPLMVLLAKHPMVDKVNLSSVQSLRYGAAPIREELINIVRKRLPSIRYCLQGYGLTESSGAVVLTPAFKTFPISSIGLLVGDMQCKVINHETGKALGPNEEGELCFKGNLVMKGYRNNADATADIIDEDGWFHSGDVGYYDEQHWIYVKERLKELIKYNAMQVSPTELESLLLQHPAVKDVAVWGLPDDSAGELPMAYVVLQNDVITTAEEIKRYVADRVSPFKKLRGGVQFVTEIPKSVSGKILRKNLKNLLHKL